MNTVSSNSNNTKNKYTSLEQNTIASILLPVANICIVLRISKQRLIQYL